jgi:hypothetical protein
MWADQISGTDEPVMVETGGLKGYQVDAEEVPKVETTEATETDNQAVTTNETAPTQDIPEPEVAAAPAEEISHVGAEAAPAEPKDTPVAFPSSDDPVAFPSSDEPEEIATKDDDDDATPPVTFPTSTDDSASQAPTTDTPAQMASSPSPGITFSPDAHPDRAGSADPESEPKRKRISSQNFQRLARRISVSARRTGSGPGIPNLPNLLGHLRRDSAKDGEEVTGSSRDGTVTGMSRSDSPATSMHSEPPAGSASPEGTPSKILKKKEKRKTIK